MDTPAAVREPPRGVSRDPIFDAGPAPETRAMGIATLVTSTLGAALLAWSWLDALRYADFVVRALRWTQPEPHMPGWQLHGGPIETIAILVGATALAASFVLARSKRAVRVALGAAAVLTALALIVSLVRISIVAQQIVRDTLSIELLRTPYFQLGAFGVVLPAMLALAASAALRGLPARFAVLAAASPLIVAGFCVGASAGVLDDHASDHLPALTSAMSTARLWVGLASLPALVLATRLRAPLAAAIGGLAWLALGGAVFAITRPLALDASAPAPSPIEHLGCSYTAISGSADFTLDTPLALAASPEAFGAELAATHREWSIQHPRDPFPGDWTVRAGATLPSAEALRPWLAAALESGYANLEPQWETSDTWPTRSLGPLAQRWVCRRYVVLIDAPMDRRFAPQTLFDPSAPFDVELEVGVRPPAE